MAFTNVNEWSGKSFIDLKEKIMLGKLEKVDLKTIWENEAYNFTPWLAQKENLELLGEVIVIEIELKAQKKCWSV